MRASVIVLLVLAGGCNCGGNGNGGTGGGNGGSGGAGGSGGTGGSSGGLPDGGACISGASALSMAPMTVMKTDLSPVTFAVSATVGGAMQDVSAAVACSATRGDDTPPGTFSGAVFTPAAAGVATITCTDGCLTTSSTVTVKGGTQVFADPGPTVTNRFNGTVVTNDAMKTPLWVYPHDETRFPRNIYKVLFQWRKQGNDFFRLTFAGPNVTVIVYSDGANPLCAAAMPAAGCYESDAMSWLAIAGGNAGERVTVTVDGVRVGDASVYRSGELHLGFSRRDVKGAIFYWSTTVAGIRRAAVSESLPEAYLVGKPVATQLGAPANASVGCVACHTVSRSGKRIVAMTDTSGPKGIFTYDVQLTPPPTPLITTQISDKKGFGTFSPDDARVVATVDAKLAEFDAVTGVKFTDLPLAAGTCPDWSPAGTLLAYSDKAGDSPGGANLSLIPRTAAGGWGAPGVLVAAAGQSNLYPSFSPDSAQIAFSRGKGGHGDRTAQLFLVQADGGTPVELISANRLVNNTVTNGQYENNMPTWAPPGDYDWIAFNTVRPYGVVVPNGGLQQIWVAAIDKSKLGQLGSDGGRVDPSFPAFRFAFQNLNENNHRAYWTLDVRQETDAGVRDAGPPVDAGACLPEGSMCSQTSGPECCSSFTSIVVCDYGLPDGGGASQTWCRPIIIN